MNIRHFYIVPWVSEALFVTLFLSCFSDWVISVDILIYLIHCSANLHSTVEKIFLKNFRYYAYLLVLFIESTSH